MDVYVEMFSFNCQGGGIHHLFAESLGDNYPKLTLMDLVLQVPYLSSSRALSSWVRAMELFEIDHSAKEKAIHLSEAISSRYSTLSEGDRWLSLPHSILIK